MKHIVKRLFGLAVVLGLLGFVAWTLRPKPLMVEIGRVARGRMQVTIDEDGQTRRPAFPHPAARRRLGHTSNRHRHHQPSADRCA